MIKFLLKGILRDKSRSLLPIIITAIGVALTVFLSGYIKGVLGDVVDQSARFETGHVKIMTKPYLENKDLIPNDLALLDVAALTSEVQKEFPGTEWVSRIRFGGLIDVPGEDGDSQGQGPAAGTAIDFLTPGSKEAERMNLLTSLHSGKLPTEAGGILMGYEMAEKLKLDLGDEVTFFGTTMAGSMTFKGFRLVGTIRFGMAAMDRGAVIVDLSDARQMLDMDDATGELLGYFENNIYDDARAGEMASLFNARYENSEDEFAPVMQSLRQQNNLGEMLEYSESMSAIFVFIFVMAMSVVLWNTGLLGGLRRYQEYGIRLALGESKGRIYKTMVLEAVLIGTLGSILGIAIGLAGTYYMVVYGFDISELMQGQTGGMMMPSVLHSKYSPELLYIGFIPGVLAMVLGNMLSGMGIYKRETSMLFKELEV